MRHVLLAFLLVACDGGRLTFDGTPTDDGPSVVDTDATGTTDTDRPPAHTDTPPVGDTDDVTDTDVTADGRCLNRDDAAVLLAQSSTLGDTIQGCVGQCIGDRDPHPERCVSTCVSDETTLSAPCSSCFGKLVTCVASQCVRDCVDPSSQDCHDCTTSHCGPAFQTCSGVPLP